MLRGFVLALTILTGFSGLAYEVTWQKYLAILLGAHSEATASVLGLFLGGLSLGYWLFGVVTRRLVERGRAAARPAPLLLVYGAVEAGIGVWCLLFPSLFPGALALSVLLPVGGGLLSFAADVAIAALLILPPTVLMGGTIPILTQALARSLEDATRFHALVYGFNTAGAFVGALAAGFVLIPWLGLEGVMLAMGCVNVAVGAVFVLLGLRRRELAALDFGARPASAPSRVYDLVALLVGFALMAFQTILIRIGGLSFGASEFTFSMVVAVFVLCIALGSLLVAALPRIGRAVLPATLWGVGLLFALLYGFLEGGPYWAHMLRVLFRDHELAFHPYYAAAFLGILCVVGPAVILSGATLPLLFHAMRQEMGGLGAQAGRLYSVNTVGSLLGALLGGYTLLFWLDLHHVYRIALAAVALAAALSTGRQYRRLGRAGSAALVAASLIAVALLPAWRPEFLLSGVFRMRQPMPWTSKGPAAMPRANLSFLFHDDDPTSSVSVLQMDRMSRSIIVNGKSDGDTRDDLNTMVLAALLPGLFAERTERAFVIGFGTGLTAGELAALPGMQEVTVAEISRGVLAAAPSFDFANEGASQNAKIRLIRSDAYRTLLKSSQRYDVIASEPSNPWVSGVEMLFSREFLEAARDRLTDGGVYAQWFHLYETDPATVELVLHTYSEVFEHVGVWSTMGADVLLIGFQDAERARDLDRLEQRAGSEGFRARLARIGIESLSALLVHETLPLGVVNAAGFEGPVHTLHHPILSFRAGRAFFRGGEAQLPFSGYGEPARIGRESSLLRRYLRRFDGRIPEPVRRDMTHRACELRLAQCTALVSDWARVEDGSESFRLVVETLRRIPGHGWLPSLPWLRHLLGDATQATEGRIEVADAARASRFFEDFYYHAVPFEPTALVDLWNRCAETPQVAGRCKPGRRAAHVLASGRLPRSFAE